jgi:hypothetical protein
MDEFDYQCYQIGGVDNFRLLLPRLLDVKMRVIENFGMKEVKVGRTITLELVQLEEIDVTS